MLGPVCHWGYSFIQFFSKWVVWKSAISLIFKEDSICLSVIIAEITGLYSPTDILKYVVLRTKLKFRAGGGTRLLSWQELVGRCAGAAWFRDPRASRLGGICLRIYCKVQVLIFLEQVHWTPIAVLLPVVFCPFCLFYCRWYMNMLSAMCFSCRSHRFFFSFCPEASPNAFAGSYGESKCRGNHTQLLTEEYLKCVSSIHLNLLKKVFSWKFYYVIGLLKTQQHSIKIWKGNGFFMVRNKTSKMNEYKQRNNFTRQKHR